jgi:cysteinyl-tRNA synthetase
MENRYRSQMDLTWESLRAANATLHRWRNAMTSWGDSVELREDSEITSALSEDLDTPKALIRLRAIEKDQNLPPQMKREIFNFVDQVLALDLSRAVESKPLSTEQENLLAERAAARLDKNWSESDRLRDLLAADGIAINDGADGQSWSWTN